MKQATLKSAIGNKSGYWPIHHSASRVDTRSLFRKTPPVSCLTGILKSLGLQTSILKTACCFSAEKEISVMLWVRGVCIDAISIAHTDDLSIKLKNKIRRVVSFVIVNEDNG